MALRSAIINVIFKAASKAARGMLRDFGEIENLQVSRKSAADFVSQADFLAKRTLIDELKNGRPEWHIISREAGKIEGETADGTSWIIDSLNGTTNFLHGVPHFAISTVAEYVFPEEKKLKLLYLQLASRLWGKTTLIQKHAL